MARAERDKGARGEREVASVFRAAGFDVDRTPNSGALRVKGDLHGDLPGVHIEVKRQETLRLPLWLRQAEADALAPSPEALGEPSPTPVVCFRQSHGRWYAALSLAELVALLRQARR